MRIGNPFDGRPLGFKNFSDSRLVKKRGESAHPVLEVDKQGHKWFIKNLDSDQEAQIECMIGEIYRYLLGPEQPKIRLADINIVASEGVNFTSVRDLIEKEPNVYDNYQTAFCENIESFLMLAFSSIFFEENDLSDANYGLAKKNGRYGGFVKIDHGQSLNTLRIVEEKRRSSSFNFKKQNLDRAEIKYFPPVNPRPSKDLRKKSQRSSLGPVFYGKRKYELTYQFMDRVVLDFVDGRVDKDYILNLTNQPSASPFYDNRLLGLIDLFGKGKYDIMEVKKHYALARLAFTNDAAYFFIAEKSTEASIQRVQAILNLVKEKIRENRRILIQNLMQDPDFLCFAHVYGSEVKKKIRASWNVMLKKRDGRTTSDRYQKGNAVDPVDSTKLDIASTLGAQYLINLRKHQHLRVRTNENGVVTHENIESYESLVHARSNELIEGLINFIGSHKWNVGFGGGKTVMVKGRKIKVPSHVASLADVLDLHTKTSYRTLRTVKDAADIITDAHHSSSRSRKASTTQAYFALYTQVVEYVRDLRHQGVTDEALRHINPALLNM
ncbi:hypothetical protein Dthio_PD2076 [Desulfonatronospira thiodismutans ASO3-1]|uniref:Uncharacterized protein n=1 Tax=Desulfonatronospira thiodismutans ASO3-1 TaxID=555779 RepID=D6SPM8_9BACT|nr:hypothetical protein [Desulfonatronospira thiodismutans]EFI34704.1 hypothetical protein Dthio_PD2076 [Desulfonatronospira thiodismutans ASO3-1]